MLNFKKVEADYTKFGTPNHAQSIADAVAASGIWEISSECSSTEASPITNSNSNSPCISFKSTIGGTSTIKGITSPVNKLHTLLEVVLEDDDEENEEDVTFTNEIDQISDLDSSSNNINDLKTPSKNKSCECDTVLVRPLVVGLTGGIASGKSSISKIISDYSNPSDKDSKCDNHTPEVVVLDADKLGHEAYLPGTDCYHAVVNHFAPLVASKGDGASIINEDKTINRKELGGIIFSSPARRQELELIVWPELKKMIVSRIQGRCVTMQRDRNVSSGISGNGCIQGIAREVNLKNQTSVEAKNMKAQQQSHVFNLSKMTNRLGTSDTKDRTDRVLVNTNKIVLVEAAIMIEAGWHDIVDAVLISHADHNIALPRLMERNNLSREAAESRFAAQLDNATRLLHAHCDILNNYSEFEDLERKTQTEWSCLLSEFSHGDHHTIFTEDAIRRKAESLWERRHKQVSICS